jgi:hypothetical protein
MCVHVQGLRMHSRCAQTIRLAAKLSTQTSVSKKKRLVGLQKHSSHRKNSMDMDMDSQESSPMQSDPLGGRIREVLPEENLEKAMLWYLMGEVDSELGSVPARLSFSAAQHYMRVQGRALTLLELWALHRGDDARGDVDHQVSIGKLFGAYEDPTAVGPDPFYKMQILKDESKNNRVGRPEITGATRHRDPLKCACNAVATMLILRFGRDGIIGELPDFFNAYSDVWNNNALLTKSDGTGVLPYAGSMQEPGHVELFADMKQAAGLLGIMSHTATKLRSFGAMHAHQKKASNPEIERTGR